MRVKIAGLGKCLPGTDVPGRVVTNGDIVRILLAHGAVKPGTDRPWTAGELTPQRIAELVGIKERRWVSDEVNTSDVALAAAENALRDAGIGWEDIGILALGSSTPEALFPSTACMLLEKVIRRKTEAGEWTPAEAKTKLRIQAFDILAACTSGLYGVDLVRKTLLDPETEHEYGLAIGADIPSRVLDFRDTNSDLWGDGAAAVVLKRTEAETGILCTVTGSDPLAADTTFSAGISTRKGQLGLPTNFFFKGHEVQRFVLKIIPEMIVRTLERANRGRAGARPIEPGDVRLFICHQANSRIFEFPSKKLGIPLERFYVNVDSRGNCSSTSVLMAMHEAREEGRIRAGDLVMLIGFGGGLTWASILLEL